MAILGFKRKKDNLLSEVEEIELMGAESQDPNTDMERRLAAIIRMDIDNSKASRDSANDDTGLTQEEIWQDEYKLLKGGGLQWTTNIAYRSKRARQIRPNSEDNFIHNAMQIQVANITASSPEVTISCNKVKHREKARKITHISRFNDYRNKFNSLWKEMVHEYVCYGPLIGKVIWDSELMGGAGPDRWLGDVRIEHVYKEDFFPDPSVLDLKRDMEKCRFVGFRSRQQVGYLSNRWSDFAKYFITENNEDELVYEGGDSEMVDLYEVYYRGFPEFMPRERVKELQERADTQEQQGDSFKAMDLRDMARGDVEGVHLAYFCNDMLLEYIPYVYDHGKFPCVFTTRYKDTKAQWGYGEIRNIKIPQILHNKADEIEIEAMSKEGLGGGYYRTGSINSKQMENIITNSGKGGMWFEVDDIQGLQSRTGVKVPNSLITYKEHKQRMIETVSQVTPIQQGMVPGSQMPYKAIADLGSRADIRTKQAAENLKDFLIELNKLRILLFAQFYTEERYYRYTESNGEVVEGTFKNDEIFDVWNREQEQKTVIDPNTNEPIIDPQTKIPIQEIVDKKEFFIPEFDINCSVISKRPEDREYSTNIAFTLHERQLLTGEDLLLTLEEGKLPPTDDIIQHIHAQDMVKAIIAQMGNLPPEIQQQVMQVTQQTIQAFVVNMMGQNNMMQPQGGGNNGQMQGQR